MAVRLRQPSPSVERSSPSVKRSPSVELDETRATRDGGRKAALAAVDYTAALIDGPWEHQFVAANGHRFHVAIAGPKKAPLVVVLHDFGQFWWAWRLVIPMLADAGYRVAALDLRGVAASDKPPHGYDIPSRTRDVAGVIRSLGAASAVVVGSGTSGEVAWAMGALQPAITQAVGALGCPHPARLHHGFLKTLTAEGRKLFALAQIPTLPEKRLLNTNLLDDILATGAAAPFPAAVVEKYREVIAIPFAAHNSVEALRWLARSAPRPDGQRYRLALQRPLDIPALQLHGADDGLVQPDDVFAEASALCRNLTYELLPRVGHYLAEEAPADTGQALTDWLSATQGG